MVRAVTWTQVAWTDLDEIVEYIAKDSPAYAPAFLREARDAARSLAKFSERGRFVPEFHDPATRELIVRNVNHLNRSDDRRIRSSPSD